MHGIHFAALLIGCLQSIGCNLLAALVYDIAKKFIARKREQQKR